MQKLRPAILMAIALAADCPAAQIPAGAAWFEHALVGMEVGPTGVQFGYSDTNDVRYCARFDGRHIVRQALQAHSEYLVFWARDGDFAYYNSKLVPKAPGLGPRDPLREAMNQIAHDPLAKTVPGKISRA